MFIVLHALRICFIYDFVRCSGGALVCRFLGFGLTICWGGRGACVRFFGVLLSIIRVCCCLVVVWLCIVVCVWDTW